MADDKDETAAEPVALAMLTAYAQVGGGDRPNVEAYAATDDPDEHADAILAEVNPGAYFPPADALAWRQTGGDDHGDGLTSFDYLAAIPTTDALRALLDWAGNEPSEGTPNGGILTGPEEWGHIPGVALFPITTDAADAVFGPDWRD